MTVNLQSVLIWLTQVWSILHATRRLTQRMPIISLGVALLLVQSPNGLADEQGWGIGLNSERISTDDLQLIGHTICGTGKYRVSDGTLVCHECPDYTGNSGDPGELTVSIRHIGHFSSARGPAEWLLDTDGCEAHYADFGGALLLRKTSSTSAKDRFEKLFYQPGFRVDDCLIWPMQNSPSLLVCNEVLTAQGESVGHISMMDVDRRGISRWRLLRWFDNLGSMQSDIVSILPLSMSKVILNNRQPGLRIELRKLITSREAFEKEPEPAGQSITLDFQLRGRRFFATEVTQQVIEELSVVVRRMLE